MSLKVDGLGPIKHKIPPADPSKSETKPPTKWQIIRAKIWDVVKKIFLAIANVGLFLINPAIYAISTITSFIISLVWPKQVQLVIDKIINFLKKFPWIWIPVAIVAGFLSLQVTVATASALFAAHLGALAAKKAEELWQKEQEKKNTSEQTVSFKLV